MLPAARHIGTLPEQSRADKPPTTTPCATGANGRSRLLKTTLARRDLQISLHGKHIIQKTNSNIQMKALVFGTFMALKSILAASESD
jgi:hypothetical protein